MKLMRLVLLSFVAFSLANCGSSSAPAGINGNWNAQLSTTNGSSELAFSVTLAQGSGSTVNSSNLAITSPSPCFPQAVAQTVTFMANGNMNGVATGPFNMTITTIFPQGNNNVITMTGNRNGNTITGAWTLTGYPGCSTGSGSFTMNLMQVGS